MLVVRARALHPQRGPQGGLLPLAAAAGLERDRQLQRADVRPDAGSLEIRGRPVFRALDVRHARRADDYIATSRAVRDRLALYYGKLDIPIVAPPVDRAFSWAPSIPREDFYLWAGRIVEPYKRVGLLIEAFADTSSSGPRRLIIAGDGRDRDRLEAVAPPNVEFVGEQSTDELASLYRRARGLLMPSEDDFGMIATEAIACGTPVISYAAGGALDSVVDGLSGVFFADQTAASLLAALDRFEASDWDAAAIAEAGLAFSADRFSAEISALLGLPAAAREPIALDSAAVPRQRRHIKVQH